ncbi:acetyltransferase (isoleucine patch superfamily)-like protein [Natrialba chahannaoensis JCM 10990]|uniref:Acetyltransferase (Isoleucine patch superfamily)-like protein n=1 Tax=Natrialba chahannaoensis JCM 10990 TaxID=1227492 RepID=M0AZ08_9EURY|nr:CatB-related O-acetyltransferase [Natrialba chahannaoensis]ELZ03213.1 acetyltransferase (isoleucine patch superfamily)-like protein [Natrialba chahannaoensis JCM 10990]
MALDTIVERSLSMLGYPTITHELLNRRVDATTLDVAPSARISMGCLLRGHVTLGPHVRLSRGCILNGPVDVGRRTNFEPDCDLVGDIEIGNYCAIARETTFQQTNHETTKPAMQIRLYDEVLDSELPPTADGPIEVGNDVWIGTDATILSGVTIGDGAIIGAGAIVTSDVDPYAVVAGVPAKRVRWRFPKETRERLLELEWWEWDEETMRENRGFFERTLSDSGAVQDALSLETTN